MKKIMLSLGVALIGIATFKTTTHNNVAAAHEETVIAATNVNIKIDSNNTANFDFYKEILKRLGANETPEKIKFLKAWRQGEGGGARNNPFNTTRNIPGDADTKYNSAGVRNYPDAQTGLDATVATLSLSYYKEIVSLLRKDDVTARELGHCASLKKWGTGNRVTKVLAMGNINPPPIVA